MPEPVSPPELEFCFEARVEVGETVSLWVNGGVERRMVKILGGEIDGPALRGKVLPGGADWQTISGDVAKLQAQYVIESDAGARVEVVNRGLRHGPAEVMERLRAGEEVDPTLYYFRATPEITTAAPELVWMTRSVFIVSGERHPKLVLLRFWKVL
jgi:hypothetical protein